MTSGRLANGAGVDAARGAYVSRQGGREMRRRTLDSIAGVGAAAVALGVSELVAGVLRGPSLVVAVGNAVVDFTPGPVVKSAIEALGTNDKPVLLVLVTIVSL